jgi:hypothetical protein
VLFPQLAVGKQVVGGSHDATFGGVDEALRSFGGTSPRRARRRACVASDGQTSRSGRMKSI